MQCQSCGEERVIAARGLCRTCYSRWQRGGTVDYIRPLKNRTCSVEGCQGRVHGQGLCSKHLLRLRRTGTVEPGRVYTHKQKDPDNLASTHDLYQVWAEFVRAKNPRPVVEAWKDRDIFYEQVAPRPGRRFRLYGIDRTKPIGPDNYIWKEASIEKLPGESQGDYAKRQRLAHRALYPGLYKDAELRRHFPGFSLDAYDVMHQAQNGRCPICHNVETAVDKKGATKYLAVEHDHRTKVIRSLACQACNTMIGHAADDIRILQSAINYLIKHNAQPGETRFIPAQIEGENE